MSAQPHHAMVLCAGLGLRMRPITNTIPKPLIQVAGRSMLDRVLDHLDEAEVPHVVVNHHWLGRRIVEHLSDRPEVILSDESGALLETGGGVTKALPLLGPDPFYVCNGDIVWFNGLTPALIRLREAWDDARMDALLLMQRTPSAYGYDGPGDFFLDPLGLARRRKAREIAPYLFAGVQILHPRLFADAPKGAFSLNRLFDRALAEGRLYGVVHDGEWFHIGDPRSLAEIDKRIRDSRSGYTPVSHQ